LSTVDRSSCILDAPRGSVKAKATSVCVTSAMAAAQEDYHRIAGHCMAAYLEAINFMQLCASHSPSHLSRILKNGKRKVTEASLLK